MEQENADPSFATITLCYCATGEKEITYAQFSSAHDCEHCREVILNDFSFAIGAEEDFLFSAWDEFKWHGMTPTFDEYLRWNRIRTLRWAAIGPEMGTYFISYIDKYGAPDQHYEGLPECLDFCLLETVRHGDVRVVFGPGESYIAWDHSVIHINSIPDAMERSLKTHAEIPQMAALGADGAYFLYGRHGLVDCHIPDSFPRLEKDWRSLACSDWPRDVRPLDLIYLHPKHPDRYIIIEKDARGFRCTVDNGTSQLWDILGLVGSFYALPNQPSSENPRSDKRRSRRHGKAASSYSGSDEPPRAKVRTSHRARDRFELDVTAGEYVTILEFSTEWWWRARRDSGKEGFVPAKHMRLPRGPRRESGWSQHASEEPEEAQSGGWDWDTSAESRKPQQSWEDWGEPLREALPTLPSRASPSLRTLYQEWKAECDALFARGGLKAFPHLPRPACTCSQTFCALSKSNTGLGACEHDVEKLLRGSGQYSLDWLRKERNQWHPDRFGLKCDQEMREDLGVVAAELFKIISKLMAVEERQNKAW